MSEQILTFVGLGEKCKGKNSNLNVLQFPDKTKVVRKKVNGGKLPYNRTFFQSSFRSMSLDEARWFPCPFVT